MPPVLSTGLKVVIGLLLAALLVLGYRYARFALSRQVFSEELILIDEEDGTLGPLLTRLGYSVIPFGPDILTDERQHLGKGATADTTRKPRAVVVAPDCFGEARGYFFLLRAYVEEGGRVLVLPHSPRAANNMPFRPAFIPVVPSDPSTVFVAKAGLWKSLEDHEVERFAASVASKECYLRVNDRALDQEFLVARNKNNGARGVQLGVLKQGKGEYILCQLNLHLKGALADPTARKLLGDLLNYLRGRETQPEEAAVGARRA